MRCTIAIMTHKNAIARNDVGLCSVQACGGRDYRSGHYRNVTCTPIT